MISKLLRSLPLAICGLGFASALSAQSPATPTVQFPASSPSATIKQRVGITDIEINYARPSAKGRKVFGGLVPYGEVWRTGANTATKVTFSTDVTINGTAIPAGAYEMFTIPTEGDWTVMFQTLKDRAQWGNYAYDEKNDTARFTAKTVRLAQPVETFAFGFNDLRDDSATLNLMWENVRVPLKLEVDTKGLLIPQIQAAMAAMAKPEPMFLFSSAMFYFENNIDLDQALEWMNAAIAARPGQMWMIYRKALILAAKGDNAGAKAAAEESMALAEKAPAPALRDEYIRLNQALIARLN